MERNIKKIIRVISLLVALPFVVLVFLIVWLREDDISFKDFFEVFKI